MITQLNQKLFSIPNRNKIDEDWFDFPGFTIFVDREHVYFQGFHSYFTSKYPDNIPIADCHGYNIHPDYKDAIELVLYQLINHTEKYFPKSF